MAASSALGSTRDPAPDRRRVDRPARPPCPPTATRLRRGVAVWLAGLVMWVAGSALGTAASGTAGPRAITLGRAHVAEFVPSSTSSRPLFILVLGSDARPGEPVTRQRSDVIHIIGINTKQRRATILDLPRDSWVDIPGYGTGKITSAMSLGGPPLTIRTIERLTGIRIDYYALTSFPGFIAMVDGIGGIKMRVPYLIHDPTAGPGGGHIPPGVQTLDGRHALALSRARHNVPGGDFGRTENQGRLLLAGLAQLRSQFAADPGVLLAWVGLAMRNVTTDLSVGETLRLAFTALHVPPDRVTNVVVPGAAGMAGDASVVFLAPAARAMYADMRSDGVIAASNA